MDKTQKAILYLVGTGSDVPDLEPNEAINALIGASSQGDVKVEAASRLASAAFENAASEPEAIASLLVLQGAESLSEIFKNSPNREEIINALTRRLTGLLGYAIAQRKAMPNKDAFLRHFSKSEGEMRRAFGAMEALGASEEEVSSLKGLIEDSAGITI
ncbi:MAG: hypothetical protein FWG30_00385 [Eubacteriaceae bacterium]|nr:hypothetical protein [Eubacteriaceae bacterium]